MVENFRHLGNKDLIFGNGRISALPELLSAGSPALILTGNHFPGTQAWKNLENSLKNQGIEFRRETVSGEPSPEAVDSLTEEASGNDTRIVIAIGGGSVLDTGKAVAAMLMHEGSVFDYLEGVGSRNPEGKTIPMIAVPTTAGTGSEATRNAVISRRGKNGFKKSLRHNAFIPPTALLDPGLAVGCPPEVSLSCGMDAFCQILESFVSTGATAVTDLLARDGLIRFGKGRRLFSEKSYGRPEEIEYRGELALAAYYSGLTLANAGLGSVHGLAGPIGAFSDVPHGVACGLLAGPVFRRIADHLIDDGGAETLDRLAYAGAVLHRGEDSVPERGDVERLIDRLSEWAMELPRLSDYGMVPEDISLVVNASSNKNSPVPLTESEFQSILEEIL
jgi:alcohol dehydrogenase class IV